MVKSEFSERGVVPDDIYRAQVDAMFVDFRSVWIGAVAAGLATLGVSFESADVIFAVIGCLLAVVGFARCFLMVMYQRKKVSERGIAAARRWELMYVLGAALYVSLLGIGCVWAFAQGDAYSRLSSLAVIAFFLIGIPGRNFASNLLVDVLLPLSSGLIFLSLALAGGYYWCLFILVVIPSFITMRRISFRLRGVYLDALLKARDVSLLADRFDTALNNIPHGIAMLDSEWNVLVINKTLKELLFISVISTESVIPLEDLLGNCVKSGAISADDLPNILRSLKTLRDGGSIDELLLHTKAERTLDLTLQPMSNGGAVLLFEDVTERMITQARLNELARFDPLTGLPNRTEFHERAENAILEKHSGFECAIMFIDLDQFKQVNDTLGHAVGDRLLRSVADRLTATMPSSDIIARFGGDEFVAFHRCPAGDAEIASLARRLIEEISHPYEIGDHQIAIGASIGIATAKDVIDLESLQRNADLALYQAKVEGRNTWRFFEAELEIKAQSRRNLELDLRSAFEKNEFELHFQPIYNIKRKQFVSCEALIRWKHPVRGRVSPAFFVPVAEEMGLIVKLDNWVLRAACRACVAWPEDIRVAVNISAVHFRDTQLVETVKEALSEFGVAPHRLEIELTETALLQNIQTTRSVLNDLRQLGVRISLDDFGTGYSSLSYLNALPFNKLKIDRSFLAGLEPDSRSMRLLKGITSLSADLGLMVVMEGVETQEQYTLVADYTAVDEIQGYFFSKPLAHQDISELFRSKRLHAA
jgi:diguanylate cyclase (GGDEF)-like protein